MDRARAVQAYVSTAPGVSQYAMRQGGRDIGAAKSNQILIWDKLADSASLILTGNTSTIYTWTYANLANDGPTVIELPASMPARSTTCGSAMSRIGASQALTTAKAAGI
jgi:hypothetical protein